MTRKYKNITYLSIISLNIFVLIRMYFKTAPVSLVPLSLVAALCLVYYLMPAPQKTVR